ncbi:MAG TPA: D-alanyl-D-alanine carboxypeptidase/D-alanyl-D-alanine-endopeptidase [Steroidobacteraceae bacterium]|nr:D-alanyl-D-alanine carboxypeptidase/D-alanyl-D-alanine-endopeptidase [Steroidobacteraceae bacterium]
MRRLFFALIALSAGAAAAGRPAPPDSPAARQIAAEHLPPGAVSFVIAAADTGRVIRSRNADTLRSPASTIKLLTTFAGLELLGPAFTWQTRALTNAPLVNGVLRGDLFLQGGGDPYMTLERWWYFAHQLRVRGVRAIDGDIVVDDREFSQPEADPGAFDGHPNRPYNVVPDALMVNFQSVVFRLTPDRLARKIAIVADPMPLHLSIDNRIRFVPGRCGDAADHVDFQDPSVERDRMVFTGTMAAQCAPLEITRAVMHAPQYAYGTFVPLWREQGGTLAGALRVEAAPAGARLLFSYDSLPLAEVVRLTNKFSNNLMARDLLLTLGERRFGAPATVDKGIAAIEEWSRSRGLKLDDTVLDNGAGLSRKARISAATLAAVLAAAYRSRYAPEFLASLPLAGLDGTLKSSMADTPPGAVRLKTGHIDGVSNVAGYVTTARGRTYILVSFVNDARAGSGAGEPVHAALVDWILRTL